MSRAPKPARAVRAAADPARTVITPEGVDLRLRIATFGARASAMAIDLLIMLAVLVGFSIAAGLAMAATAGQGQQIYAVIWLLGAFLLRNAYFIAFELGPRAAFNVNAYAQWLKSGFANAGDATVLGPSAAYRRSPIEGLSANAAISLDYLDSDAAGEDLKTAAALLGLRYDF